MAKNSLVERVIEAERRKSVATGILSFIGTLVGIVGTIGFVTSIIFKRPSEPVTRDKSVSEL